MKSTKTCPPALMLVFILLPFVSFSQRDTSLFKLVNPPSVATPRGYSHAAVIDLGNCKMIIISGQVALDSKGNLVGPGDMGKQSEQVFTNIKNILTDLGGSMDHIVKFGMFVTDVSQIQTIRNVRDKYVNVKTPPASTLVQVSKLFREDILVEIEATAIIPKK